MKKTGTARRLAWSIAALSLTLTVAGLAASLLALVQSTDQRWLPPHLWFSPLVTITFSVVGALVASRQPHNPIGWICGIIGLLSGLTLLAFAYRMLGESAGLNGSLPGIEIARWIDIWIWI